MEAAGIIALVRATTRTALQARTLSVAWKDAPRDVLFLRDELETCKEFLESIQLGIVQSSFINDIAIYHGAGGVGGMQTEGLKALLIRAERIVLSLAEIMGELLGKHECNSQKLVVKHADTTTQKPHKRFAFRKKVLWIRRLEVVTKLRKMLRRTTDDIALQLMILNVNIMINASPRARCISDMARDDKEHAISHLLGPLDSYGEKTDNLQERLAISTQRMSQCVSDRLLEEKESMARCWSFQETSASGSRKYHFGQMRSRLPLQYGEHDGSRQRITEAGLGHGREATAPSSFFAPIGPPRTSSTPSTAVEYRNSCQHPATDVINSRWELRWLQHIWGSMEIIYSQVKQSRIGSLDQSRGFTCHCKNRPAHSSVLIQYHCPLWLANATLSMYLTYHSGPELLIRVSRVVSTSDYSFPRSLISRIRANDVESVKKILQSHPYSINDTFEDGNSALSLAITHHRTDIVRLLLGAGASPFRRDERGMTAALLVLNLFVAAQTPQDAEGHMLIDMIPISRILEEDGFTDLHKAVMGNITVPLDVALANHRFRSCLNSRTATGLTPLHLAAHCHYMTGDVIRQLAAAGADLNAMTVGGGTPLTYACWSGNEETARALLEAGASPHFASRQYGSSYNLLYHAARWSSNLVDLLLKPEHGLDINGADGHGMTALCYAAMSNNAEVLSWLIARGADMDTVGRHGETPLHEAIMRSAHQSARILLALDCRNHEAESVVRRGLEQRYRYLNCQRGWGICHYLAEVADGEMMNIFAELRMTGLPDPSTFKDIRGKTALDLFQERTGVYVQPRWYGPSPLQAQDNDGQEGNTQLIQAWKNLLGSINRDVTEGEHAADALNKTVGIGAEGVRNHDTGGYESDSELVFFDARES